MENSQLCIFFMCRNEFVKNKYKNVRKSDEYVRKSDKNDKKLLDEAVKMGSGRRDT